ncbi:MAG: hemolysin family protein [Chloroflexota bacterium]|nr:hemolysin family protein [Chloroflexota bacterium]MDQ5867679.1 hemolysin family protein [Chloroflexota bacterium]
MEPDSWIALVAAVLCLVLIAIDSAVETALTHISGLRLRQLMERGVPRAQAINDMLADPQRFSNVILFVNVLSLLAIGALAYFSSSHFATWWSHLLAVSVAALLVLVFGVAVPKALAVRNPERTALALYGPINTMRRVIGPLVALSSFVASPFVRVLGGRSTPAGRFVTEEELRMLVNVGEEEGVIQQEEEELIHSIFEFGDTVVREVMAPRPYIVAVEDDCRVADAADVALQSGHTRIPVYHESIDSVLGVATVQDMLRAIRSDQVDEPVTTVMRPVHYVPETKKVDELLRELQRTRMHLAIVVDEYGGTAGLVTIEDLLEEIVGEIRDEYDVEPQMVEVISDTEAHVDARVPLDDINELFHVQWEAEDSDTIGGFVYEQLGRVPDPGDALQVDHHTITVLSTEGTRIKQLAIIRHGPEEAEDQAEPEEEE